MAALSSVAHFHFLSHPVAWPPPTSSSSRAVPCHCQREDALLISCHCVEPEAAHSYTPRHCCWQQFFTSSNLRRRGVSQAMALQRITDIEKSFKGFERQLRRKWIYFRFESPLSGLCPDLADQQQQGVPGKQFQEESQFNLPLIVISTGKECEEPGNFCRCRCNKFYGGHHWPISAEEGGWMSAVKAVTLICNKPLPKDVFSVSWRVVKSSSSGFIFRYNLTVVSVGTAHHRSP